jgi:AcrR family transcriptional regulator
MPGRGRPRALSLDDVVDAALDLIDSDGVPALSMQSLARRLGTGSATLYNYVASRDELVDLMLGRALAEQPPVPAARDDWAEDLVGYLVGSFRAGLARPAVLQLWHERASVHLGAQVLAEHEFGFLAAVGFSPARAAEVYRVLSSQLLGHIGAALVLAKRPASAVAPEGTTLGDAQRHLDALGEERVYEQALRLVVGALVRELADAPPRRRSHRGGGT